MKKDKKPYNPAAYPLFLTGLMGWKDRIALHVA